MAVRGAFIAIVGGLAAACLMPGVASPAPARTHATRNMALALRVHAARMHRVSAARDASNSMAALDDGVLQQLNRIRVQHGLVPLKLSASLSAAAAQHTREMASDGYFEHNSYDGTPFWKRIQRFYGTTGYGYWSVGENLLWSSPDTDPAAALQLWMNSPEHRANILTPRWREIGIAAVHVESAPGTYDDLPVTIITTDFGVRR